MQVQLLQKLLLPYGGNLEDLGAVRAEELNAQPLFGEGGGKLAALDGIHRHNFPVVKQLIEEEAALDPQPLFFQPVTGVEDGPDEVIDADKGDDCAEQIEGQAALGNRNHNHHRGKGGKQDGKKVAGRVDFAGKMHTKNLLF